jgi:hypothetical protein
MGPMRPTKPILLMVAPRGRLILETLKLDPNVYEPTLLYRRVWNHGIYQIARYSVIVKTPALAELNDWKMKARADHMLVKYVPKLAFHMMKIYWGGQVDPWIFVQNL